MSVARFCLFVAAATVGCSHPQTAAVPGSGRPTRPVRRQMAGPIAEHAGQETLFEVAFNGSTAFRNERPASIAAYVYRDGTVIYGVAPCGAPNGLRSRQVVAERISAVRDRLDRECDSIEDDGRQQCEDGPTLWIRCDGRRGSRRVTLTCQPTGARGPVLVGEVLGLLGLPRPFSTASSACALARLDAQIPSIDEAEETYPDLYMLVKARDQVSR